MSVQQIHDPLDLRVAPGARVVHVGLPKSGSTALQKVAHHLRPELRKRGVVYPGTEVNHIKAAAWLTDEPVYYLPDPAPRRWWWETVRKELAQAPEARGLVSYEAICWTDLAGAQRVAEAMGRERHAVLVLRNIGDFAPSVWQQNLKSGNRRSLHEFLRDGLRDPRDMTLSRAFHRTDGRDLVSRWAEAFGPENLTVVVLDRRRPDRLFSTFEGLLALDEGMLSAAQVPGDGSNRGLSAAEAALILRLNRTILDEWERSKTHHRRLLFGGAIPRLVATRRPGPDEGRIGIPSWAVGVCQEAGHQLAESVRASGVRLVGDLAELERAVTPVEEDPVEVPDTLPSEIALEGLLGMFAAATGWDWQHERRKPTPSRAHRPGA